MSDGTLTIPGKNVALSNRAEQMNSHLEKFAPPISLSYEDHKNLFSIS